MTTLRHGHRTSTDVSPTYYTWVGMKSRCLNKRNRQYRNYGGRGITVCPRWLSFENFLADMGERPVGLELDRIDNNGNYEPGNCRWVRDKQNSRNRRDTRFLVWNDVSKPLVQWAEEYGLSPHTVRTRLRRGMTVEQALTAPLYLRTGAPNRTSLAVRVMETRQ